MRRIVIWSRSRRQSVRMPHTRWCRLRLWISHKRMQRCHLCLGAKYKHSESWRSVRNTRRLQFSCTIWFCTFVFFVRTRDIAAGSSFILQWSPVGAVTRLVEHPMPCSNVKPSHDFNAWCRLLQLNTILLIRFITSYFDDVYLRALTDRQKWRHFSPKAKEAPGFRMWTNCFEEKIEPTAKTDNKTHYFWRISIVPTLPWKRTTCFISFDLAIARV